MSVPSLSRVLVGAIAVAFALDATAGDGPVGCVPTEYAGAAATSTAAAAGLPAAKRTKAGLYLTAADAGPMIERFAPTILFVDVRTRGELQFTGMPTAADAHVPYMFDPDGSRFDAERGAFVLAGNPGFVAGIDRLLAAKGLTRADPVVLICQGGGRAAKAADALTDAGFLQPWIIVDGFEGDPAPDGPNKGLRTVNGWRNAGLAWTTKLDAAKMYGRD